jgi:thioesterase domain-containing protein
MMKHNAALARSFRPGRFDGDIQFFFADQKKGEYSLPEAWQPFITGRIDTHVIHCKHSEMTEPVPLKEIGRILEQYLLAATTKVSSIQSTQSISSTQSTSSMKEL